LLNITFAQLEKHTRRPTDIYSIASNLYQQNVPAWCEHNLDEDDVPAWGEQPNIYECAWTANIIHMWENAIEVKQYWRNWFK
jgi:hypothetical protein